MLESFKKHIKKRLPNYIIHLFSIIKHPLYNYKLWKKQLCFRNKVRDVEKKHLIALKKLDSKKQIRCIFLALLDSVWKYDYLYKLMEKDDRFYPIILVCPIVNYGKENMLSRMENCFSYFKNKNYHVIKSYDSVNDKYIDLKKDLTPDIIFYTNPYKGLIDDRYYIDKFEDVLTVYVSYNYGNSRDYNMFFNLPMHNFVWRNYAETLFHKSYAESHASNRGRNVVVTGYPGIESFITSDYRPKDIWINKSHNKKRIIWAPHHSIEPVGIVYYSCFLKYADFMLSMAHKYRNSIELCFKPHPLLKNKLYHAWGKEKTEDYYRKWQDGENTFYIEGEYIDLFMTSDAMIHDSGSFLIEYLYVNKPVMRTYNGEDPTKMYNDFTLNCLDYYYKAFNEKDIETFIVNVIQEDDSLKSLRTKFVNDVLIPKGGMPSENIINDIIDSIKNCRL